MDVEVRSITQDEIEEFVRAESRAFGGHATEEDIRLAGSGWLDLERAQAAFVDGGIVGTIGARTIELAVPGGVLPASGVTSVSVLPTHRRRGVSTRMMRHRLDEVRRRGDPLAILWASESSIYGRFGYGRAGFAEHWTIERPYTAIQHMPQTTGQVALLGPQEARKPFAEAYGRVYPTRPGMVRRDSREWDFRFHDPEAHRRGSSAFFHAVYAGEGRSDGYALYNIAQPDSKLIILELVAATDEAYAALWSYCFGVDLMVSTEAHNRPVDDPLQWMLADPRRLRRATSDTIWLRLVDVAAALARRQYATSGVLVLAVSDSFCPWNQARYELDGGPEGAECRVTTRDPDLELSASDLASVYLGAVGFRTLFHAGRVRPSAPDALTRADAMFSTEMQPWCGDFF